MKFLCKILLLFFITFLTAPTIVSIIDSNATISFFYNVEEDDTYTSSFDEIKCIQTIFSIPLIVDFEGFQKVKFSVFNDTSITSIVPKIFLRPPELI